MSPLPRKGRPPRRGHPAAKIHFFIAPNRYDCIAALAMAAFVAFVLWERAADGAPLYAVLRAVHRELGRLLLGLALVMALVGGYIGLLHRGDVRPWYRRLTYAIILWVASQGLLGALLWFLGGRPGEDVHIIYGFGAVLALPFFAFVEITAQKRPAMGSYIWGFTLLLGILLRSLLTGA
ncbi:MAG: hypothetical protein OXG09_11220 [Chloroflexi bacterium]|nr:hypothetical protein [Chloroflexota bacterium]